MVIFYGIGIYALCLTMNIFSVAAERTIALLRAARGVGFVLSLITTFLVFDAILSLKSELFVLLPLVFASSFLLYFQGYWTTLLSKEFSKDLLAFSLTAAFVTTEIAVVLYFWPVTVVVGSLLFTAIFYMVLGLGQAKLEGRLFAATIREHLVVGIFVLIAMLIATRWGG